MTGERWFWLDVGTACGAIVTDGEGKIIGGAPHPPAKALFSVDFLGPEERP